MSTGPDGVDSGYVLRGDPTRLAAQHRFARTTAIVMAVTTGWIVVCGVVAALTVTAPLWVGFAVCALVFGGIGALMIDAARRTAPPATGPAVLAALDPDGRLHLADGSSLSLAEVTGIEHQWQGPTGRPASPGARVAERLVREVETGRPELARSSLVITFHRGPAPAVPLRIGPVALPADVQAFVAALAGAADARGIARWWAPPSGGAG